MQNHCGAFDDVSDGVDTDQRRIDVGCGHDTPDNHLALIYESREEQFATVVPFVRAGLERGDRCLYVSDGNTTGEVVEAMERADIDVAAARETGQLSLYSTDDIYLPDGSFDPEDAIGKLEETVSRAIEGDGFDHVRFTGEMTWALDDDAGVVHDALAEYEAKVNDIYPETGFTGLCQYDRDRFPPAVLQDVLRTHPRVVYDDAVCRNVFYVPPAEFLDESPDSSTVDRRLRTVRTQRERRARNQEFRVLIQAVVTSLAGASTRKAIEQAVCDHLTDVESWQFAWVGETNATSEQVASRATAGDGASYLDDVTVSATSNPTTEPAGQTAVTGSPQTVDDVRSIPGEPEWRREALDRGFESVASVPLVYEGVSYGVVSVYGDEPGAFSEPAPAVLADVGRAVALACNAVERRRALLSDRATELDLRVPGDDPFVDFVAETGGPLDVDGVVPEPDSVDGGNTRLRIYFTVDAPAHERVEAAAAEAEAFSSLSLVSEEAERLTYDGLVDEAGLLETFLDHAAVPKSFTPEGDAGRVAVRLPASTDVASFFQMLQDRYAGTELVARREVESEPVSREGFRSDLRDRLTERQWDALQTAYLSGYFEWPRERSGEEVGERLDVSQPTFNRHLRDSLRKLLTPIFDDWDHRDR